MFYHPSKLQVGQSETCSIIPVTQRAIFHHILLQYMKEGSYVLGNFLLQGPSLGTKT